MENERDNKGITLIELIVVIAIMAILTAVLGVSFSVIGRRKVSNAASSFKQTMQLGQTYAKSKGACKMTITATSDNGSNTYIYTAAKETDLTDPTKYKLGNGPNNINKNITIEFYFEKAGWKTLGSDVNSVNIYFDRKTGGIKIPSDDPNASFGTPVKVRFSNGDKTTTLNIAKYTGVVTYAK